MKNALAAQIRSSFQQRFSTAPLLVKSPGRVNIIGEHTDYNEGFVLPAAIDKAIYVGVSKREDQLISLYSEEFNDQHQVSLNQVQRTVKQWPNYMLGVVAQLQNRGYAVGGFNLNIGGDVPIGSGLSSSAAVECATAFALNELFGFGIDRFQLVLMAQKAEHEFAGVMCGIMDQFASMFGKKDHVIKLDCRSIQHEYEPLDLKGYKIVLLNTNVKHSLASSEYNTRRNECMQGVEMIRKGGVEVNSLRDVTLDMLEQHVKNIDQIVYRRCKYVVEENQRLLDACAALEKGDLLTAGKYMFASHDGLQHEYEVSCKELDFLVDAVRNDPAVAGARMTGGGFGGCTINFVAEDAIEPLVHRLSLEYEQEMGKNLTAYIASTEDGSHIVI